MTADTSVAKHAAQLAERAGEVALCLDFDGTLSPIVDDPEAARALRGIVELPERLLGSGKVQRSWDVCCVAAERHGHR
jgi:trehalose-6-phosphatase